MSRPNRGMVRFILLVVVPVLVLLVAGQIYVSGLRYVDTENAYVRADIIAISADVEGRVIDVAVHNNQRVERGQLLFKIDPEPFRIDLARAEAELARVRNEIEGLRAEYQESKVELAEAEENIRFYTRAFRRQQTLSKKGVASRAKYDEAENLLNSSRQRAQAARQKISRLLASLGGEEGAPLEEHAIYVGARAARDRAALDLKRTEVKAPLGGIVSNVGLEAGEYVEKGERVFPLVAVDDLWVVANLKETQLTNVEVGQTVSLVVDAYPDHEWTGKVTSISPSTGAEFAILPPQNATGNWVKVVQRVPVKVVIDRKEQAPPLRTGMTVGISIDTGSDYTLFDLIGSAFASKPDKK